jgi:hypothetical protein
MIGEAVFPVGRLVVLSNRPAAEQGTIDIE